MAPHSTFSLTQLHLDVQEALKQWQDPNAASVLAYLQLFRQLQQAEGGNARHTANRVLLRGLAALEAENGRFARILRLRFLDDIKAEVAANQLGLAGSTIYALQSDAIQRLAELLYVMEVQARAEQRAIVQQRLEASTYDHLVGAAAHLEQLTDLLIAAGPPWLIAIEGMGGIGKTALADALLRRLIELPDFADIGWVTARQANFDLGGGLMAVEQPALTTTALIQLLVAQLNDDNPLLTTMSTAKQLSLLQTQLKARAHLIVIDNLETLLDVKTLLPLLRQLANPTRFLLTTRERFLSEPGIYHFEVPELSAPDALYLVRKEAADSNVGYLKTASDEELRPIYATVGGNPLALRLVVGQSYFDNLELVLADLVQARGARAEKLYTFLYQRAWANLDEDARSVWLALPVVIGRNATSEMLTIITGLAEHPVRMALEKLLRLNLVNAHGSINSRYYTLHNLTRAFLQEQVGKWR